MERVNNLKDSTNYDTPAKLEAIHRDIKRLMERTNQEYLDLMMANLRKDFIDSITVYLSDDIENGLEKGMVNPCPMRDTCKSVFTAYLEENSKNIRQGHFSEETIARKRDELNQIREKVSGDNCDTCFQEVNSLFEKQLNIMDSLQIYSFNDETKTEISVIDEEKIVKNVLEPLSNRQRLQIMKYMASQTRSFSALSEFTGHRGGNLLFHLQKLLENDLIVQRHERGDYMITKKGFNLLLLLADFQKKSLYRDK
ncbi:winged helix-turn-helix domain-containing protein [Methanobacterium sp. BAmetb5]|uniref:winged helix-turn-helix domain-containing protein n=1 Tax=Methanobacterium sp. BAmetb5 TaxID=2025351 RepID=UPI000E8C74CB|nr:winged helix-turn-helix domain-containing protein [Methanobacterium sp. BAmetb5]AXV40900.1 MAG: transcriptional regulator [Methanobacterium sp. BAmetb5]